MKSDYRLSVFGRRFSVSIAFAVLLFGTSGCADPPRPETIIRGKWQSAADADGRSVQFEFLADGSVIQNERQAIKKALLGKAVIGKDSPGEWRQLATGTFKFADSNHLKMELKPEWWFGNPIYEVRLQDNDHLEFVTGGRTLSLTRLK